jgi:HD-GYP domain-containing protein (c-di-GMP phosphodiesterase class II)
MSEKQTDYRSIIKLTSELNKIQDLDLLLERILLESRRVVHADAGSIYELAKDPNDGKEKLFIKYSQNDTMQRALPPGQKLPFSVFSVAISDKNQSGYCALTRKLLNVADVYHISADKPYSFSDAYDRISGYKTTSTLTVPLLTPDGQLLGVMQMINAINDAGEVTAFSTDDEFIITHFAAEATTALNRAYDTREMILRMIKMAELRDPKETGTHVNRVAGYAVEIYDRWAYKKGVSEEERERFRDDLKIASMLHDVGKVAISDTILKKPARFTPDEYKVMQHHTVYGASIFNNIRSATDELSYDIALNHHENWDGTGYPGWVDPKTELPIKADANGNPLGKKGEEIPLAGRIVAIADVFDALSSKRVYKDPWTEEQVLDEMRKLGGTKFEPELIDAFFDVLPIIRQIQSMYPEAKTE